MIRPEFSSNKIPLILLVDDIPENLKVIGNTLMDEGYQVIVASSGPKAIELTGTANPDLILLDVQMPGMNGLEVCRILKQSEKTRNIPVIFLTARNDTEDIIQGFEAGGVDYITKPYNAKELLLRIKNHTDLQLAREEVYQLNATKDKFFSIIAHDLRNPFQAMLGISEILKGKLIHTNQEELLHIADLLYNAASSGYELLQNLLVWANTQMKKIEYKPQTTGIKDEVEKCFSMVKLQAHSKHVHLENLVSKDQTAHTDPAIFQTILRNLVMNGIKYTNSEGKVSIASSKSGNWVEVSVCDTGVGMDAETVKDLFQPDKVKSSLGTGNEPGTGLGLLLCKEFIKMYNGQIWVESTPGNGSCFTFTIPAS